MPNQKSAVKSVSKSFDYWWRTLDRGRAVSKVAGVPTLAVIRRSAWPFMARVLPRSLRRASPAIEVFEPFLKEIALDVTRNAQALVTASLFAPPTLLVEEPEVRGLLVAGTRELAESFLLLHEMFHICCGHLGWYDATRPLRSTASYNEITLGMAEGSNVGGRAALQAARYREMEADNSALQWLIRWPLPSAWQQLCRLQGGNDRSVKGPILELEGATRRIAFASVLNATWLMTAAL